LMPAHYCELQVPEYALCERCVSCGPQAEINRVLYAFDESANTDYCKTVKLPSQCSGDRFEQAICKFTYLINNPRLVCNGQYHWWRLAEETFKTYPGTGRQPPFPDGGTLNAKLASHYLKYGVPRNPEELKAWFIEKYGDIDRRDVNALRSVSDAMCF